ncbi:hypothetical protein HPB50_002586 [Hyalomma asiaticum]|uniref:Uncharacterized protein n=1 Tax=Hyalomma asiaticum TaxID=266040 RepID=A0ACB7SH85_HYAAI|nr:hypothetical protein HPB50_002586 [Hyalomma asiaticum]
MCIPRGTGWHRDVGKNGVTFRAWNSAWEAQRRLLGSVLYTGSPEQRKDALLRRSDPDIQGRVLKSVHEVVSRFDLLAI